MAWKLIFVFLLIIWSKTGMSPIWALGLIMADLDRMKMVDKDLIRLLLYGLMLDLVNLNLLGLSSVMLLTVLALTVAIRSKLEQHLPWLSVIIAMILIWIIDKVSGQSYYWWHSAGAALATLGWGVILGIGPKRGIYVHRPT
jgi:hypothetical protein